MEYIKVWGKKLLKNKRTINTQKDSDPIKGRVKV